MKSNTLGKLVLIVVVIAAVVAVFMIKNSEAETTEEVAVERASNVVATVEADPQTKPPANPAAAMQANPQVESPAAPPDVAADPLPKLVDLGATTCIPCKKMAPILDKLAEDFAGRLEVVFIDVRKDRAAGVPYKIRVIPTQIFYDPEGNELFRHEGFFSRDDILTKWAEYGFDFLAKPEPAEDYSVSAYYFHWTIRCQGCLEIEAMSREAIFSTFADDMREGDLQWITRDMDLPEYAHFLEDFELNTPSLVLVRKQGEQIVEYKVLAAVWEMKEEPAKLQAYVTEETQQFLAAPSAEATGDPASG